MERNASIRSGSDLTTFVGASFTGVSASLAFDKLRELVAFLLAGHANIRNGLRKGRRERRVDARQRRQCAARGDQIVSRLRAIGHAGVLHRQHVEAMTKALVPSAHAFGAAFHDRFVFGRMHHVMRLRVRRVR